MKEQVLASLNFPMPKSCKACPVVRHCWYTGDKICKFLFLYEKGRGANVEKYTGFRHEDCPLEEY